MCRQTDIIYFYNLTWDCLEFGLKPNLEPETWTGYDFSTSPKLGLRVWMISHIQKEDTLYKPYPEKAGKYPWAGLLFAALRRLRR